jgi:hypothetical protein
MTKSEVRTEAVTHVVPVKYVCGATSSVQLFFSQVGNRGFSGGGKACEPEEGSLMAMEFLSVLAGDVAIEPGNVIVVI